MEGQMHLHIYPLCSGSRFGASIPGIPGYLAVNSSIASFVRPWSSMAEPRLSLNCAPGSRPSKSSQRMGGREGGREGVDPYGLRHLSNVMDIYIIKSSILGRADASSLRCSLIGLGLAQSIIVWQSHWDCEFRRRSTCSDLSNDIIWSERHFQLIVDHAVLSPDSLTTKCNQQSGDNCRMHNGARLFKNKEWCDYTGGCKFGIMGI